MILFAESGDVGVACAAIARCIGALKSGRIPFRTPMWDKAALFKDRQAFIEHLQRLEAEGCRWLVIPLAEDESSGPFRCSKCATVASDAAPLYSLATHIVFEQEVLRAIEASSSEAEFDGRVSRIIEEEPTPMVCGSCCPRGKPHRHDLNHAFE